MHYELKDIIETLSFKRTKIQQWIAYGYVRPSIEEATGSGTRNKWSFADIITLAAFGELIKMGLSRAAASKLVNLKDIFSVKSGRVQKVEINNEEFFDIEADPFSGEIYDTYLVQFREGEVSLECGVWGDGLTAVGKVAEDQKISWANVIVLDVGTLAKRIRKKLGSSLN